MKTFQRIDVPPDGSCFFHAVGILLGTRAQNVKKLCINGILQFADTKINGTSLREWISMEGYSIENYIRQLQKETFWGGAIEMNILCILIGRPIVVYSFSNTLLAEKIAVFHEWQKKPPLSLLYLNRNHYAALVPTT